MLTLQHRQPYAYVTDHLGGTRAVVDMSSGAVVERSDYYPYGVRIGQPTSSDGAFPQMSSNRWRYAGKEEQTGITGLPFLDFGARQYDPALGSWLSQDPLAKDYPSLSPYAYCAGDPVNLVDPEGKDIWTFDLKGHLISQEENKEYDEIRVETEKETDDEEMVYNTIRFSYGTIRQLPGWKRERNGEEEVDFYVVNDDKKAKRFFEFMADNTNVEWAHMGVRNGERNTTYNTISTSHEEFEESSSQYLYSTCKSKGHTIRFINHNHSKGPSLSQNDEDFIKGHPNIPMSIYLKRKYYVIQ